MAKDFLNTYRLKNGTRKTPKTYYSKITVDGKRRFINTGSSNRKEAEKKA